jgi:hypothetical protein
MTAHSVTVDVPEILFRRIERTAKGLNQPMSQALLKIVESNLPSLDKVPAQYRTELEAMESWTDQHLWRAVRETMPDHTQVELNELLWRNKAGTLNSAEQARLDELHHESDRFMLRKSYALALLKWRGNQVPAFVTNNLSA